MAEVEAGGRVEAEQGVEAGGRVARRRALVRQRLLRAAEALMLERGVEAVTIEEITDAADIARRTFYWHFASKDEVLLSISRARSLALDRRLAGLSASFEDPAEGLATAMRHAVRRIPNDPLCRWFAIHSGLPLERVREAFGENFLRDFERGCVEGRFSPGNAPVVLDLVASSFVAVIVARVANRMDEMDADDAVASILMMLGLGAAEARRIAHRPLPALPGRESNGSGLHAGSTNG